MVVAAATIVAAPNEAIEAHRRHHHHHNNNAAQRAKRNVILLSSSSNMECYSPNEEEIYGRTSSAHLLTLVYGRNAHSAAVVIQRAFRARRIQSQFEKLMSLALSADRLDRRLSLLGPGNTF